MLVYTIRNIQNEVRKKKKISFSMKSKKIDDETKENKVKILIFHLNLRACYKNNDFLEMERR